MEKVNQKVERILVIKAAGIGDLILSVPALRALRSKFPDAEIDLLISPKCSTLFKRCPYVNKVYLLQKQGMMNRVKSSDLGTILRTVAALRRRKYDILINLCHISSCGGALRMKLLCKAIGARLTIGRNTAGRGTFYDLSPSDSWVNSSGDQRHDVDLSLDVVRLLGAEDPGQGLEFWVEDEERARVQSMLAGANMLDRKGPRIVLNLGGDALYKRWPEDQFAKLGDLLTERRGLQVLLVGGAEDRPVADQVITRMKEKAADFVGRLNVLELAALLESCDLMVTNDTGPMHLAAALDIPVVALFGPGKPGRYAPYGREEHHVALHYPVVCSPCTHFDCRDRDCMRMITAEKVLQEVERRLMPRKEVCP